MTYSGDFDAAWLPAEWAIVGVLAGGVYGLVSSAVAVRRHLRSI